ncbi:MAG: hypothetical protein IKD90_03705 [Clostridiales bacterium]|nr:hypothetical protein [Clostridiales bacterium]
MNTVQTAIVFVVVFLVLCMFIVMSPLMYKRTFYLAEISVSSQDKNNEKKRIFEVVPKTNKDNYWNIENSCPEKAYRFAKGLHDSVNIIIG